MPAEESSFVSIPVTVRGRERYLILTREEHHAFHQFSLRCSQAEKALASITVNNFLEEKPSTDQYVYLEDILPKLQKLGF